MDISDPTGQVSGMALFPEDFDAVRKVFDLTNQVILTLEVRGTEGQFDPVARSAAPMEAVVADAGAAGLRIHVAEAQAIQSVRSLLDRMAAELKKSARGPVQFCVADPATGVEYDIDTGQDFPLTPQIRGAIKAMGGVVLVEEV
jgi:DNA polymerase-3 subunit alpha